MRMNRIASIRSAIGISQSELAGILGISRTALAMAENDRRKLSGQAVVKLGRLEIKHIPIVQEKKSESEDEISEETKESFRIFLEEKKTKCTELLVKYQKQLDEMISINVSAKKRKSILKSESEMYEGVGQYQAQLENLLKKPEKKIKRFHPGQRLRIQFEIAQLELQIRHIEKEFNKLS